MGIVYILLIPLGIERIIVPLIEYPVDSVLYVTNTIAELKYLIIPIHTFSALSVVVITLGLLWLCLWEQDWRFFGNFFIILGICLGLAYKTHDILVSADNIAIKENDTLLYSLTKKNRNFVVKTWARQNGQDKIVNHAKYNNANKRLQCDGHGCVYQENGKLVLLANKKEDILKHCNNVDLIFQLRRFDYSACNAQTIRYDKLEVYGTHSIWLTRDDITIKKARSSRPWHKA